MPENIAKLFIHILTVFVITFVSFTSSLEAASISGKVTDINGDVIEGADVCVRVASCPGDFQVKTDSLGKFNINNIPPFSFVTEVNARGYLPYTSHLVWILIKIYKTII